MSAGINTDNTSDIMNTTHVPAGLEAENLITFDGLTLTPPPRSPESSSPFCKHLRHVLSHQTTMNIFDPINGEYGTIMFNLLEDLSIFNLEDFLNPEYWDIEIMFRSDIVIKTMEQANAANHLDSIHVFLTNLHRLHTIEGCTAFNLESPIVNGMSPFLRTFQPIKHGIFSRTGSQERLRVWGQYMQENHGLELQSISTIPTAQQQPAAVPLSPFALCIPTRASVPPSDHSVLSSGSKSIRSSGSKSIRSSGSKSIRSSVSRRDRRTPRDSGSIRSTNTIPRSIQHDRTDVYDHDPSTNHTRLQSINRIPLTAQSTVPHPLICQTKVESFDHAAYMKTKGEDRSDFVRSFINTVITDLANHDRETFRALFCLTNPSVYGYLFRKPRTITSLPIQVTWNGQTKTFAYFLTQFKGALRQRMLAYLFDVDFKKFYLAKQMTLAITCDAGFAAKLTHEQLEYDSNFLYGSLQQAVASNPTVLLSLDDGTNDGIALYYRFIQKHLFGGSTSLKRTELMAQANVAYTSNYVGGTKQFLHDKVVAFHTLNLMDNSLFHSDILKISALHDAFQLSPDTWSYASAIKHCTEYADAIDQLNNLITIEDHSNLQAARRTQINYVHDDIDLLDDLNNLHVNVQDLPAGLVIHNDLRNILSKDTLRLIVKERNEHIEGPDANNTGGETQNNTRREFNNPPRRDFNNRPRNNVNQPSGPPANIGRQYEGNANNAINGDIETPAPDEDIKLKALHTKIDSLMGIISDYQANVRQVRVTLDYYHINLSLSSENHYVTAIDNGADTCVIGKGWHILHYLVGPNGKPRKANLVGYDPSSTRTNGLPMVSATCIVQLNNEKILLIVNQAVYNESQALTLLSEYQLKHNDWIVDTTHKKHKSYNASGFGSQQMEKGDTVIPLQLRSCLMTFNIRVPTDQELTDMKPITLTDENPWNPKDHDDTDDMFFANAIECEDDISVLDNLTTDSAATTVPYDNVDPSLKE